MATPDVTSAPCRDCGAPLSLGSERCSNSGAPCADPGDITGGHGFRSPSEVVAYCPPECEGHPADEFGPMGETSYCDGSCRDAYDDAYDVGYDDGRRGSRKCPPGTDADVNYFDGYADGAFAAYQERL